MWFRASEACVERSGEEEMVPLTDWYQLVKRGRSEFNFQLTMQHCCVTSCKENSLRRGVFVLTKAAKALKDV